MLQLHATISKLMSINHSNIFNICVQYYSASSPLYLIHNIDELLQGDVSYRKSRLYFKIKSTEGGVVLWNIWYKAQKPAITSAVNQILINFITL